MRVFALLAIVALLSGCTPQSGTPVSTADSTAAPAAPNPFSTIARRLTAPTGGKSVDQLETESAKKPGDKVALKALGLAYYNAGGYEPAIATLGKLQGDPEAAYYQAASLLALAKDKEALALLKDLKTPQAALLRADYNYLKGVDVKAAAEDYTVALKAPETQGEAALALGTIVIVNGDRTEAKKLFALASEKLPAGPSRARAYSSLGRMAEEGNDSKVARGWYKKALKDDPENGWAKQSLEPTPPPASSK
ncbi:MAG: hypothetical protein QM758_26950 [Armatimonas sp.]